MKGPAAAIMSRLALLSVLLFVAACYGERRMANGIKPLTREMTDFINSIDTTWKVSVCYSPALVN